MEQQITITSKTQSAKNPKCTIYETSNGKMSAWEQAEELNKHMNKLITVDVRESNGFKNITKFINVAVSEEKVGQPAPQLQAAANSEPLFRLNITKNTKGFTWECTVRADTEADLYTRLNATTTMAREHCQHLEQETAQQALPKGEVGA